MTERDFGVNPPAQSALATGTTCYQEMKELFCLLAPKAGP